MNKRRQITPENVPSAGVSLSSLVQHGTNYFFAGAVLKKANAVVTKAKRQAAAFMHIGTGNDYPNLKIKTPRACCPHF